MLAALLLLIAAPATTNDFLACAALQDDRERLACYDRAAAPDAQFGAESLPKTASRNPAALAAHIRGSFIEWKHGTAFDLDNGQVWKVMAYDHAYDSSIPLNPAVTITESALGGYWMKIDGTHHSLRVRRVK